MQIDERVLALLEPARANHERPAEPRLRDPVARYDRELAGGRGVLIGVHEQGDSGSVQA